MDLCRWSENWNIGDATVDAQHRSLVAIINTLYTAMLEGRTHEILDEVLSALVAYTVHHFQDEEAVMIRSQFPDYARHKQIHEEFTEGVLQTQAAFRSGGIGLTTPVMHTLRDWLVNHIQGEDQRLGIFLREGGIK